MTSFHSSHVASLLSDGTVLIPGGYSGNTPVTRADLYYPALTGPAWPFQKPTRDFNHDGRADVLWRDATGNVSMWLMNGTSATSNSFIANIWPGWSIAGSGDFDGDGKADILWRDTSGEAAIWLMNGTTVASY